MAARTVCARLEHSFIIFIIIIIIVVVVVVISKCSFYIEHLPFLPRCM